VNEQWLKYAPSKNAFPLTHPDDVDLAKEWEKAVTSGEALDLEVRVRKVGGQVYRYHLLRAIPIREGDTIIKWVGTFTDIEDQKQAIRKKDEFISIASHELKTPLTTIKAYIQLLDRAIGPDDPTKMYVDRTLVQVRKLDNLIVDLLDLSKIESGKLKFNKKIFNFETTLSTAIEMIGQTYPDYRVVLKGKADVQLYGDEMRIEQVLINYLTNAVKYSPDNKEIQIEVSIENGRQLCVRVRDFGIGIQKDHQSNIFHKFYRVEEAANKFQGLGIGLYICAEIIRRHEGSYGVDSELGQGSVFYFSIPVSNGQAVETVNE
jgi:signal transduction histidine kinase